MTVNGMRYDPARLHPKLWTLADIQAALDHMNHEDNFGTPTPVHWYSLRNALERRRREIIESAAAQVNSIDALAEKEGT